LAPRRNRALIPWIEGNPFNELEMI
jgi:hypothetical protein